MCFQCIPEEAELDSGTSCVPVGGSPAITHTNTLRDSHQECRAVMQRSRSLPPTSTHTHTHPPSPPASSTPSGPSVLRRLGTGGRLQTAHLSISRLGTWGPQSSVPSHTAGPVLLYHEGLPYQIPISWPDSSVLQIWNQPQTCF